MKRERAISRDQSRRPRTFDDADFLACVSDVTRQGAIRYRAAADPSGPFLDPGHEIPRLLRLPELLRAADAAGAGGAEDLEAVKLLLGAGTGSLGGARPKAAVLGDDGRQLIAKFPHGDDAWDVMAWEATALALAEAAGLRVPVNRLVPVDGRHVLLLDRFDRDADGRRIGYVSAMTLLERRDGEFADYLEIADLLAEVSASATEDAHELFRRVVLSVALNNTDDHLRNHGFLHRRGGWSLSPVFDVNPNPDHEQRQTTIAGAGVPAESASGLAELAAACRLAPSEARSQVQEVVEAVDEWREVAIAVGVPRAEIERFEDAFDAGRRALLDV
ncbi:type II toxin-antitoxin system HipA family toxin [Agromyces mangrovi Wang et al. 2018]|uniref:type II toxin-antitoxin system HipA family toxin n=1 Tax=Agromyces mangrovi TaxID=1858653 RepID=UPI0025731DCD|nr:HipA domain-containing protein [Agromyces mangrovi]